MKKRLSSILIGSFFCLIGITLVSCISPKLRREIKCAQDGATTIKGHYAGYPQKDLHEAALTVLKSENWEILNEKNPILAKKKGDKVWLENLGFSGVSFDYRFDSSKTSDCMIFFTITVSDNSILIDSKGSKIGATPITPMRLMDKYHKRVDEAVKPIFLKNFNRETEK